jgi:hypothetical protein
MQCSLYSFDDHSRQLIRRFKVGISDVEVQPLIPTELVQLDARTRAHTLHSTTMGPHGAGASRCHFVSVLYVHPVHSFRELLSCCCPPATWGPDPPHRGDGGTGGEGLPRPTLGHGLGGGPRGGGCCRGPSRKLGRWPRPPPPPPPAPPRRSQAQVGRAGPGRAGPSAHASTGRCTPCRRSGQCACVMRVGMRVCACVRAQRQGAWACTTKINVHGVHGVSGTPGSAGTVRNLYPLGMESDSVPIPSRHTGVSAEMSMTKRRESAVFLASDTCPQSVRETNLPFLRVSPPPPLPT